MIYHKMEHIIRICSFYLDHKGPDRTDVPRNLKIMIITMVIQVLFYQTGGNIFLMDHDLMKSASDNTKSVKHIVLFMYYY